MNKSLKCNQPTKSIVSLTCGVVELDGCRFASFYFAWFVWVSLGTRYNSYLMNSAFGCGIVRIKNKTHNLVTVTEIKMENNLNEKCRGQFHLTLCTNRTGSDNDATPGQRWATVRNELILIFHSLEQKVEILTTKLIVEIGIITFSWQIAWIEFDNLSTRNANRCNGTNSKNVQFIHICFYAIFFSSPISRINATEEMGFFPI